MSWKKLITFIFILTLAFFAINFAYPKYLNLGINFLNSKNPAKWELPHFWQVPFKLGLDLQGGSHLVYEADLAGIEKEDYSQAMRGLRDVIERRVNIFGVTEPVVQVQEKPPHYRLIVELAGVKDINQAIKMIGETPFLEFREPQENYLEIIEENRKFFETGEGEYQDPFLSTNLTGQYLKKADLGFDQTTNKPLILLQFNDEGSRIFEQLTKENIGKPLAIYIDGIPISTPVVQDVISGGRAQITGNFTVEEAKKLARNLNAGALPVPIKLISQRTIGPLLGKISLEKSLKAGLYGFLAVVIFLILFYRLPGLFAALALGIYVAIILSLFKLIPVTLSLAGIGGFILSLGMAVDANVLIFARMKEELKEEKSLPASITEGFQRAWPSIRDGNLTTLIVALILFSFGTGFVKGFAMTLGIGIVFSMFSAILITKTFLRLLENTRLAKVRWLWG